MSERGATGAAEGKHGAGAKVPGDPAQNALRPTVQRVGLSVLRLGRGLEYVPETGSIRAYQNQRPVAFMHGAQIRQSVGRKRLGEGGAGHPAAAR